MKGSLHNLIQYSLTHRLFFDYCLMKKSKFFHRTLKNVKINKNVEKQIVINFLAKLLSKQFNTLNVFLLVASIVK